MSDFRIANVGTNSSSLTQAQSDLVVQELRNKSTKGNSSKIDKAAHDFESILVGQFLEKAEKSFASVPGSDPDKDRDSAHDQFQSIACESLAKGLSKGGGFGIAAMISKHLTAIDESQTATASKLASGGTRPITLEVDKSHNSK
jgi:Rod binding domain-containing protein